MRGRDEVGLGSSDSFMNTFIVNLPRPSPLIDIDTHDWVSQIIVSHIAKFLYSQQTLCMWCLVCKTIHRSDVNCECEFAIAKHHLVDEQ